MQAAGLKAEKNSQLVTKRSLQDKQTHLKKIYTLSRSEIIRGFNVFQEILSGSQKVTYKKLTAYINYTDVDPGFSVKAGFLISKKKLKKQFPVTA